MQNLQIRNITRTNIKNYAIRNKLKNKSKTLKKCKVFHQKTTLKTKKIRILILLILKDYLENAMDISLKRKRKRLLLLNQKKKRRKSCLSLNILTILGAAIFVRNQITGPHNVLKEDNWRTLYASDVIKKVIFQKIAQMRWQKQSTEDDLDFKNFILLLL